MNALARIFLSVLSLAAVGLLNSCATNTSGSRPDTDRFTQADTNHNGVLDRNEVSDYIVNQIFDSRDANHDGRLTDGEWTGGDPARLGPFKRHDTNHDGVVTKQEAIDYARTHGRANQIMRDADKNHDGVLSRAEAQAYVGSKEGPPG